MEWVWQNEERGNMCISIYNQLIPEVKHIIILLLLFYIGKTKTLWQCVIFWNNDQQIYGIWLLPNKIQLRLQSQWEIQKTVFCSHFSSTIGQRLCHKVN